MLKKSDMAELNDMNKSNTSGKEHIKTGQQYRHQQEEVTEGKILHSEVQNSYCSPRVVYNGQIKHNGISGTNT
jgi:hypothetical protein